VVPVFGFIIVAYVLVNTAGPAKIAGLCWLSLGGGVFMMLKLRGRQLPMISTPPERSRRG
jgi:hypothetical protein